MGCRGRLGVVVLGTLARIAGTLAKAPAASGHSIARGRVLQLWGSVLNGFKGPRKEWELGGAC